MVDLCMKYVAQILSFFVWLVGSITSILGKFSDVIDDSISIIAGVLGIIGGIVWLSILRIKKKNVKLEYEIKKKQLENLENIEI